MVKRAASLSHDDAAPRPTFIIPGAAKSGTTYLARVLDAHPEVFMSYPKEPHFFVTEKPYGDTVRTWEDYLALFRNANGCRAIGEASTAYIYHWEETSRRIAEFLPHCRILILVRNPVDRAYSMYWQNVRDAREPLSFEEALAAEERRVRHRWEVSYHYTGIGYVADGIHRFTRVFGEDRVKVVLYDDLFDDVESTLSGIMRFLGVSETGYRVPRSRVNLSGQPRWTRLQALMNEPGPVKRALMGVTPRRLRRRVRERISAWNLRRAPRMADDTRAQLVARFDQEIAAIEEISGRSLASWKKTAAEQPAAGD